MFGIDSPLLLYILLIVAFFLLLRRKLRGRKREYIYSEITDDEKNILCEGEFLFQFNALLEHKPTIYEEVKIILTNTYLMWSSNSNQNKIWKVIDNKELIGSKLNTQNSQSTTNRGHSVTISAFSESNKQYFTNGNLINGLIIQDKKEIISSKAHWIRKMVRLVYLQSSRVVEIILFGQEASKLRHHLSISFLFIKSSNGNSDFNSSASLKLQSLRFHRLLLHTCTKCYSDNSVQVLAYSKNNSVHIPEAPAKRNIKFIVNPVSGNKQSKMIIETLKPFLDGASELIDYDITYTERWQHGKEIAKEFDYRKYNGVVCVGGDGMIFEVINGIMNRENGEEIMKQISIGIIPAGTGNGIAATLGFANDIEEAILRTVRGRSNPLDVVKIHQENNPNFGFVYSCLQVSYGMMPDVDFDSEKLRLLGELRFTLYAMYLIFFIRRYPIKLKFKPDYIKRVRNKKVCLDENDKEMIIETRALWIGGLNTKFIANEFMGAPNAQIDDGLIHVIILPILNKLTLFMLLFDMSDGKHINHDGIQLYGTKSFEIVADPYLDRPMRLDVDGENLPILPSLPVHAECMPGLCNIYV